MPSVHFTRSCYKIELRNEPEKTEPITFSLLASVCSSAAGDIGTNARLGSSTLTALPLDALPSDGTFEADAAAVAVCAAGFCLGFGWDLDLALRTPPGAALAAVLAAGD